MRPVKNSKRTRDAAFSSFRHTEQYQVNHLITYPIHPSAFGTNTCVSKRTAISARLIVMEYSVMRMIDGGYKRRHCLYCKLVVYKFLTSITANTEIAKSDVMRVFM